MQNTETGEHRAESRYLSPSSRTCGHEPRAANREPMRAPQRMTRGRKSMARIKHVLTERAIEEAGGDRKKLFELKRLINAK